MAKFQNSIQSLNDIFELETLNLTVTKHYKHYHLAHIYQNATKKLCKQHKQKYIENCANKNILVANNPPNLCSNFNPALQK